MSLFQDSGSSPGERLAEAERLLAIIDGEGRMEELSLWEQSFVMDLGDRASRGILEVSPKMLFKLRDIRDKCIR